MLSTFVPLARANKLDFFFKNYPKVLSSMIKPCLFFSFFLLTFTDLRRMKYWAPPYAKVNYKKPWVYTLFYQ